MKKENPCMIAFLAVENFMLTPLVFVLIVAKHLALAVVGVLREINEDGQESKKSI